MLSLILRNDRGGCSHEDSQAGCGIAGTLVKALAARIGSVLIAIALAGGGTPASPAVPDAGLVEDRLAPALYPEGKPRPTFTIAERMRFYRVAAVSIAVVNDYRVAWARAYGLRNVAAKAPADPSTLFQACSMSKPVFAAGILRLFEQRGLSLDRDVNAMLHSWHVTLPPGGSPERITVRRLLSHTAGTNVPGFLGYDRDRPIPTLLQVLDGVRPANNEAIRVTSVPGSAFRYSGGGTTIGEQLVGDLTGEPFPAFMEQMILRPLGMSESTFSQPLPESLRSRAADGYYSDGSPVHRGWHVYPTMAAAGLWSTPADLAKFIIAIQSALKVAHDGPIDGVIAREMTTPSPGREYALGLLVKGGYFMHAGANMGFQGEFLGLLRGGRGVAIMTNSDNGIHIANEIVHAVATVYGWPVLQPAAKSAVSLDRAALSAFVGLYRARIESALVTLDIRLIGGTLSARSSVDGLGTALYAETAARFYTLEGATFVFTRDRGGKVASVETGGVTYIRRP